MSSILTGDTLCAAALSVCQSVVLQTDNESIIISRNASLSSVWLLLLLARVALLIVRRYSLKALTNTSALEQL